MCHSDSTALSAFNHPGCVGAFPTEYKHNTQIPFFPRTFSFQPPPHSSCLNSQISATSFKSFHFSLFFSVHTVQNDSSITVGDFRLLLCPNHNFSCSTDVCVLKKSYSFLIEAAFEYIHITREDDITKHLVLLTAFLERVICASFSFHLNYYFFVCPRQ